MVIVAPSRARGLKRDRHARPRSRLPVAPSRARGLKRAHRTRLARAGRRALTGAWIETNSRASCRGSRTCRALTGAWIETSSWPSRWPCSGGRALMDAWIETRRTRRSGPRRAGRALTGAWIGTTRGGGPGVPCACGDEPRCNTAIGLLGCSFNCRVRVQVWLMIAVPRRRASRAGSRLAKNIYACAPSPEREISSAIGTPSSTQDCMNARASSRHSASSKSTASK